MKFNQLASFEKHLAQAPASLYGVAAPCPYDRRKIVEKIVAIEEGSEFHTGDAAAIAVEAVLEELNSYSLFGQKKVFYLDNADKLKKGAIELLTHYATYPAPSSCLIVGANGGKCLGEIFSHASTAVVCDLSAEKPWEKKERLKHSCVQAARTAGKEISPAAVDALLEQVGLDLPALEREIEKLSLYVSGSRIDAADVKALCFQGKEPHLFRVVEDLIWHGGAPFAVDLSELLLLIALLRTQLQQGLTMAILLKQGFSAPEIGRFLPNLRSIDKLLPLMRAKKISYFTRGLQELVQIEFLAKNSGPDPSLLLECFIGKLRT